MSGRDVTPSRSISGETLFRSGMPTSGFQNMMLSDDRPFRTPTPSFSRMNSTDYAHEHGRLTEKLAQKNDAIDKLRSEAKILATAHASAKNEISSLKAKLRSAEAEKQRLLQELGRVSKELDAQKEAMSKTEEKLKKQATTIKVQSEAIQRAGNDPNKNTITPHRNGHSESAYANIYNKPPPTFNPHSEATTPSHGNGHTTRGASASRSLVDAAYASSERDIPTRGSTSNNQQPSFSSQLSQRREIESTVDLAFEIKHIFILSDNWARTYANAPPEPGYEIELPNELSACIDQYTNKNLAANLMSSCVTRYFCVAKLINYQVTTYAFRPLLMKGFTAYYDSTISEYRKKMHGIIPLHIRRAHMAACAEVFTEMTTQPGFQQHIDRAVRTQVHKMWTFLEPLFAPGIARNQAWGDLVEIWKEAARVGVLMTMKPSNFNLEYPAVGCNSLFNPAQMVNRDQDFRHDPQQLSQMGVEVRLAITPVITETDYLAAGLVPKVLHYAHVLLCR